MALDIPPGGFSERQAEDVISGIINRSTNVEEAPKDEPRTDVEQPVESVRESADEREDQSSEPTDKAPEQVDETGPDTSAETESDKDVSADDGEPETHEYDHGALAQALGIDEDDLVVEDGRIQVRAKVNGEELQVNLADLKNNFQMTSAAQKGMQELAQEKKQFQEERKKTLEEMGNQATFFEQALYAMEQEYLNDYGNTNWSDLERNDPDEHSRLKWKFNDRKEKVEGFKKQYQQAQQQIQKQMHDRMVEIWEDGSKKLVNAFNSPSYRNAPKWGAKEGERLSQWMVDQGFPAETISTLGSWQVFKWARDSMLRDEELQNTKKVMKKVVKLPKVKTSKPGTPATKEQKSRSKLDEAKMRQRKASKSGRKNFNETVDLISKIIRS